jgi:hypothetical protein
LSPTAAAAEKASGSETTRQRMRSSNSAEHRPRLSIDG